MSTPSYRLYLGFALLSGLAPASARANSASYNGVGGTPLPVANRAIRMVKERIHFIQGCGSKRSWIWKVRARYVFHNTTDRAIELDLGFPVVAERISGPRPRKVNPFSRDLTARVDGRPVTPRLARHGCDRRDRRHCYDFVYLFPVRFEAGARVSVTYTYAHRSSGDNAWEERFVDYILNTGALWKGPIGSMELVFSFRSPQTSIHIFDEMFHRNLGRACERKLDRSWKEGGSGYITICGQELRPPRGAFTLWTRWSRFQYSTSCLNGNLTVRLRAWKIRPRGNISLSYRNLFSGERLICPTRPAARP
jgi:hypothetical protein